MSALRFGAVLEEQKLAVLTGSPLFRALVDSLPARRGGGRPSDVSPAAALFVGAVVAVYQSTRKADTFLEVHWLKFRRLLVHAGYSVPLSPPRASHWHAYRTEYLSHPEAIEEMLNRWRPVAVAMAADMGLGVPGTEPVDYLNLAMESLLFGDGCWFKMASELGYSRPITASRAGRGGAPREVYDAVVHGKRGGKTAGYPMTAIGIRGPKRRQRIIVDVDIALAGNPTAEIDHVIERLGLLLPLFPVGGVNGFVYDGAMRGKHHRFIRARLGLLSVNKLVGFNKAKSMKKEMCDLLGLHAKDPQRKPRPRDWVRLMYRRPAPRKDQWTMTFPTCTHRMGIQYGALWTVENERPNLVGVSPELKHVRDRWGRPCRTVGVRRIPVGDRYRWEVDVRIHCPYGPHVITFDPNASKLKYQMRRSRTTRANRLHLIDPDATETTEVVARGITLSQQFGVVDQTHTERFARMFGRRNDAESWNSSLKNADGLGSRARPFTRDRFLVDLLLVTTVRNTLAWLEHSDPDTRQADSAAGWC